MMTILKTGASTKKILCAGFFLLVTFFITSPFLPAGAAYDDATFATTTVTVAGYNVTLTGQIQTLVWRTNDIDVVLLPGSSLVVTSLDKKDFSVSVTGNTTHVETCGTNDSRIVFSSPASVSTSTISIVGNCAGASVPAQVSSVVAAPLNLSAQLSWGAPSNGGTIITDYIVEYKQSSASVYTLYSDGVSSSTGATITGLTNGISYDVRIAAVNAIGIGATSSATSFIPSLASVAPSAPLNVSAVAGNGSATVYFSMPASNGSSPISNYIVTASPGGNTASGSVSPLTVTGLTSTQSYTFTVVAVNGSGQGAVSSPSNAVVPTMVTTSSGGGGGYYSYPVSPVSQGSSSPVITQVAVANTAPVGDIIMKALFKGMRGADVVTLQKILLREQLLIVTQDDVLGLYGAKTEAGVKALQCRYGVVCSGSSLTTGWGVVGPKTISLVNRLIVQGSSSSVATQTTPPMIAPSDAGISNIYFTETLTKGSRGEKVREMQKILIKENLLVTGKNDILGLYGAKTESAIKQFQCARSIVCSGSASETGWGIAGKITLSVLEGLR